MGISWLISPLPLVCGLFPSFVPGLLDFDSTPTSVSIGLFSFCIGIEHGLLSWKGNLVDPFWEFMVSKLLQVHRPSTDPLGSLILKVDKTPLIIKPSDLFFSEFLLALLWFSCLLYYRHKYHTSPVAIGSLSRLACTLGFVGMNFQWILLCMFCMAYWLC